MGKILSCQQQALPMDLDPGEISIRRKLLHSSSCVFYEGPVDLSLEFKVLRKRGIKLYQTNLRLQSLLIADRTFKKLLLYRSLLARFSILQRFFLRFNARLRNNNNCPWLLTCARVIMKNPKLKIISLDLNSNLSASFNGQTIESFSKALKYLSKIEEFALDLQDISGLIFPKIEKAIKSFHTLKKIQLYIDLPSYSWIEKFFAKLKQNKKLVVLKFKAEIPFSEKFKNENAGLHPLSLLANSLKHFSNLRVLALEIKYLPNAKTSDLIQWGDCLKDLSELMELVLSFSIGQDEDIAHEGFKFFVSVIGNLTKVRKFRLKLSGWLIDDTLLENFNAALTKLTWLEELELELLSPLISLEGIKAQLLALSKKVNLLFIKMRYQCLSEKDIKNLSKIVSRKQRQNLQLSSPKTQMRICPISFL